MTTFWKRTASLRHRLIRRLDPRQSKAALIALLVLLLVTSATPAFAQSGIPVIDMIIDQINEWKRGLAMLGMAIIAVGLLARKFVPEWASDNRTAFASMLIGGFLLTQLDVIANIILGGS